MIHKLKRSKSNAVTENMFLEAFFNKTISVDELQGESKQLIKGGMETYAEILEFIQSYYRALETDELICDTKKLTSFSLTISCVSRDNATKEYSCIYKNICLNFPIMWVT